MHYLTAADVLAGPLGQLPRALFLTIIPEETRAVNGHLADLETVVGVKGTLYRVGRHCEPAGDWMVVVASSQQGNVAAGAMVSRAHADFHQFTAQIVVGVGGSLKEDIPIGSVVVGELAYAAHSGKEATTGFQPRPHSCNANPMLRSAAELAVTDGDWTPLIKDPLNGKLPDPYPAGCAMPPAAFLKPLASTEVVLASSHGTLYQQIRQGLSDAAAVEMEGYGAMKAAEMENTPAIVVRGISDLCHGKGGQQDAAFQPIAAAHAAAMAMRILSIRSMAGEGKSQAINTSAVGARPQSQGADSAEPDVDARSTMLLNFEGSPSDFTPARVDALRAALVKLTGDESIEIAGIEPGSARVIVEMRGEAAEALTAASVRDALKGELGEKFEGVGPLERLDEATIAVSRFATASRELLAWDRTLPNGRWLERPELEDLLQRVQTGEGSTIVLLGEPGSGKSALLSVLANRLQDSGIPVLAIKADLLPPQVEDEQSLREALGLSSLPGDSIIASSMLGPVVLAIDQLDALASHIDLKTGRLNALMNLVRRVGGIDNVHVILSARTFEYNHDVRLRAVEAQSVTLQLPPLNAVADVLKENGVDPEHWPEDAKAVIRGPQALKTFLLIREKTGEQQPFSTYQAMLERLWSEWILRRPDAAELSALAASIAVTMGEEEILWLGVSRFDDRLRLLEMLQNLGILVRSESDLSVGFSHQTVFDHVLARTFVRRQHGLSNFVIERQQSLFVRGKLWSALTYLRGAELQAYEREIHTLWGARLRPHLEYLLIEFLGSQAAPTDFEESLLAPALNDTRLRPIVINAILGSRGWFARLQSFIRTLMAGDREEVWTAFRILLKVWDDDEQALRLAEEVWGPDAANDDPLWSLLESTRTWNTDHQRLALLILDRTPVAPMRIDNLAASVAVDEPGMAAGLVLAGLNRQLARAREFKPEPFPQSGSDEQQLVWRMTNSPEKPYEDLIRDGEWSSLPDLASHAPRAFLDTLWPFYRALFTELADLGEDRPDQFHTVHRLEFDLGDDHPMLGEPALLSALRLALEACAKAEPQAFLDWVQTNQDIPLKAHQTLVAYVLSLSPDLYASFALDWVLNDVRRLQLGNSERMWSTTARLVQTASAHWSSQEITRFEDAVLSYGPALPAFVQDASTRKVFMDRNRKVRLHLLSALPEEHIRETSRKLVATERRTFVGELDRGITFSGVTTVGSPMSTEAMLKARDADILRAFEEVPDSAGWDHPTRWSRGGNIQLSRAFAEFAKQAPERAIRIIRLFRRGQQERAAGYALDALAEAGFDRSALQDLILALAAAGFGAPEFIDSASRAVERIADKAAPVTDEVIRLLETWLAAVEPVPVDDGSRQVDDDAQDHQGSLVWGYGGITVLPGGAFTILSSLCAALLNQGFDGRDRLMAVFTDYLERDPNPKTWLPLLTRLQNAGGKEPKPASEFLSRLFSRVPELAGSPEQLVFLAHAQWWDHELVRHTISPWRSSPTQRLRQAFGELVTLIALVNTEAMWAPPLLGEVLTGEKGAARTGVAYAAANLFESSPHRRRAADVLIAILADPSAEEMKGVFDVFRLMSAAPPDGPAIELLQAVASTPASVAVGEESYIVSTMQGTLPHAAGPIAVICRRLVDAWRDKLSDMTSGLAMSASDLADVALTLHRLGGASRLAGIEIFEKLIEVNAFGARETMWEIDGRFDRPSGHRPRRIPRRAKRGRARRAA